MGEQQVEQPLGGAPAEKPIECFKRWAMVPPVPPWVDRDDDPSAGGFVRRAHDAAVAPHDGHVLVHHHLRPGFLAGKQGIPV